MKFGPASPRAMPLSKEPSRWNAGMAFVVIGAVFGALALKTWRRWPDLLVDFGAQLYVPWQISNGAVLYRDVAYLTGGPLSQYYHALLFAIFGVSFLTVVFSNLAILAVILTVMYRSFYRCSDQLTAVTICVAVLTAFAFAQYPAGAAFNYITPYSAEAVHGLLFSILAMALLARWIETQEPRPAGAAGLCAGLTLLTKPDIFLALALVFIAGSVMFWRMKRDARLLGRSVALMAAGGMIPPAGFFLLFFRVENIRQSLRSVFAAWTSLMTTRVMDSRYYHSILGMDEPLTLLGRTAIHFVVLAAVVGVCAVVCQRKITGLARVILPIAVGAVLLTASWKFDWFWCGRCLPLVCLTLLVLLLRRVRAGQSEPGWVFVFLWTLWSLVLLAKLGVFWRIFHYGFVLAMPAFVSSIYLLLWMLPRELQRHGVRPFLFRTLLTLLLLAGLGHLTRISLAAFSKKTMPIASGADTMLGDPSCFDGRDAEFGAALRWVQDNVPHGATLCVLPQGAMLNYLSRHPNPCGYADWNPFDMAVHGQANMRASFIKHSPDYVVLMFVRYYEYGESIFGSNPGFGSDTMEWIDAHYQPAWRSTYDWFADPFGICILNRMTAGTPTNAIFHYNLGEFDLKARRTNEAVSNLTAAVREDTDLVQAYDDLGSFLLREKHYDEAISQLQRAIRLEPGYAEAHYNLAKALREKNQMDEAISQFREVIRLKPDFADAHHDLGMALNGKGRIEEAIGAFREVVRLKPDSADAHNDLGSILGRKGQIGEAIAQFQEAIRLNPDLLQARDNLARALRAKGAPTNR